MIECIVTFSTDLPAAPSLCAALVENITDIE